MTMAAAIESRTADAPARPKPTRIAHIDVLDDLAAAEPAWRTLEAPEQCFTAYQRFDFLSCWQREVGARNDARPLIVIGYDAARRPLLLLPLALTRSHGLRIAAFMGGKHTTFNMGLWNREFVTTADVTDLHALILELRQRCAADVLALTQQPMRWCDVPNPFARLAHQPSVNDCPALIIQPGSTQISNSLRRRLKAKERKLQKLSGYRHYVVSDDADIERLLDWFFRTKPLRMTRQRLPNVFAEPGVTDFIHKTCLTPRPGGGRLIDIHALECDEEIIALYGGVADGQRFSMMFNSYTLSPQSRFSPGLVLMRNIVDHYVARGYRALDLGVGSDSYKRLFCKCKEPTFDNYIGLTARGRLAAAAMSAAARGKHLVKRNQVLLGWAEGLRKAFGSI
jgi:CelD/BcsL family acetyltransferase involved in cellulose biosynthesis